MSKFLMICTVAADFIGFNGDVFRITPKDRGVFVEAPEWVKDTLLFKLLVQDGSIRVAETISEQKKLENDPMENIGADGKETEVEEETKVIKTRKASTKKKG